MRTLMLIGFVIALGGWSVTQVNASPPFSLTQRSVPPAIHLPLAEIRYGPYQQVDQPAPSIRIATGTDGANPYAGLVNVDGVLYGTTFDGGKYGNGTVFAVTVTGTERVLYSFEGGADGANPQAGLVNVNGVLYGTTPFGGQYGDGTVFAVTRSGQEHVLHTFKGGADGATPYAGLVDVNGILYGTTFYGGQSNPGTVFAITITGQERVLHTFTGGTGGPDGANPYAGLIELNGILYGTTFGGGGQYNPGTVFAITTTGKERVLYAFTGGTGGADGANPYASLINSKGILYGTTFGGGGQYNPGTVFAITTTGKERVLHAFTGGAGGADGANPYAGLVDVNEILYGTTFGGGGQQNRGTIFAVTTTGKERVLHAFTGGSGGADGANPYSGLVEMNGILYGTTFGGGGRQNPGTVFAVTTSGKGRVLHSFGG